MENVNKREHLRNIYRSSKFSFEKNVLRKLWRMSTKGSCWSSWSLELSLVEILQLAASGSKCSAARTSQTLILISSRRRL